LFLFSDSRKSFPSGHDRSNPPFDSCCTRFHASRESIDSVRKQMDCLDLKEPSSLLRGSIARSPSTAHPRLNDFPTTCPSTHPLPSTNTNPLHKQGTTTLPRCQRRSCRLTRLHSIRSAGNPHPNGSALLLDRAANRSSRSEIVSKRLHDFSNGVDATGNLACR
jgi:hypothetical protein